MVGAALKWVCYTPTYPYLQMVIPFFYSMGIAAYYTITPSMTADVIDVDEWLSGERREAMFSAVGNLVTKIASSGMAACVGLVIAATGFIVEKGGDQTPETFFKLRMFFSLIPASIAMVALIAIWGYSLTESRVLELQKKLAVRRAEVLSE
jgi:glycoside/pentoside/hexuronide:cation symporter, GPH family